MIKSNLIILILPFLLNFFILFIIIIPIKKKIHPIILIFILISIVILLSIKINFIFKSWIPFIIFLTIIGGLIIIYIYITRLANNEFIEIKIPNLFNFIIKFLIIILPLLFLIFKINLFYNNQESWNFIILIEKKNELNLTEIYNLNYNSIIIFIFYLFISIICIINICYKSNSPLRQLYFYE